jgi:maltooligosyltrehalose trehalohydrolase
VAPFWYFVSHSDPGLIEAVRQGRQQEFTAFDWPGEPPDPMAEATLIRAGLDHHLRQDGTHQVLWEFYRELLCLRRELNLLTGLGRRDREVKAYEAEKVLWMRMIDAGGEAVILFSFGQEAQQFSLPWPQGRWRQRLDTAQARWQGPGSDAPLVIEGGSAFSLRLAPQSCLVYLRQDLP